MEDNLGRLMRQCSLKEYCAYDIKEKLRRKSLPQGEILKLVEILEQERFIDDSRYARAFMRDKLLLSGWGKDKIFFALKRKQIASEILSQVWEEVSGAPEAEGKMRSVISNKWNSLKGEILQKRVEKTLRFALGRGFRYEEILKIIEDCKKDIQRW